MNPKIMTQLFVIPTPIGNLEDITLRAIRILKEVDLILAEDTRTSSTLLKHYQIDTKLRSYHQFNEHVAVNGILKELKEHPHLTFALISDAGTPGISDPGYLLIHSCIENNITVECLPGATAFVPALVKSGFPSDTFLFKGFIPQKKGRQTFMKEIESSLSTVICYESPHRLLKTLEQFIEFLNPERQISVSREISKKFEETINGTPLELKEHFELHAPKGEFVIVIDAKK
jgi:16S rRNA (cytidine1402-2'-O)-methyltransferase